MTGGEDSTTQTGTGFAVVSCSSRVVSIAGIPEHIMDESRPMCLRCFALSVKFSRSQKEVLQMRPSIRFVGFALILFAILKQTAFATDLGQALNFGVLSTGSTVTFGNESSLSSGDVGGTGVIFQASASTGGDIVTKPLGINMKKGSSAGNCVTSGSKVIQADGTNCLSTDTSGSGAEVTTLLPQALADVATFVAAAKAATPTQQIASKIVVPVNGSESITDNQTGLNIITVPSIRLKKDSALILFGAGNETDHVVLIVAGNLQLGADSDLAPSTVNPSFTEANLVILVLGHSVSVGKNAVLNGTLVAPNASCTLGAGFATLGAFICGKSVKLANQDAAGDSGSIGFTPATGVVLP